MAQTCSVRSPSLKQVLAPGHSGLNLLNDGLPAARIWLAKREAELALPGALTKPADPTLADVIDQYNKDTSAAALKASPATA